MAGEGNRETAPSRPRSQGACVVGAIDGEDTGGTRQSHPCCDERWQTAPAWCPRPHHDTEPAHGAGGRNSAPSWAPAGPWSPPGTERRQWDFEGPGDTARGGRHASSALGRARPVLDTPLSASGPGPSPVPPQAPDLPPAWEPRTQLKLRGEPLSSGSPSGPALHPQGPLLTLPLWEHCPSPGPRS